MSGHRGDGGDLVAAVPLTTVRSVPIADPGDVLTRLPTGQVLAWVRDSEGLVGWGEFARLEVDGPDTFGTAAAWWDEQVASLDVEDLVRRPGSGPICFGSAAFDDRRTGASVFVIPRVVLGRRAGQAWLTTFGAPEDLPPPLRPGGPATVAYAAGAVSTADWCAAVAVAVDRIRAGGLAKVVLARDVIARTEPPVDQRFLLQQLAHRHRQSWTFAVDGLIGSTPELLVSRFGREVTSRVLAGTVPQGRGDEDERLVAALVGSAKDQSEHGYAVRSVADALTPYCRDLEVPDRPQVLRLATLAHLATDVTGRLDADTPVLHLVEALHPTAAVCGTPTDVALDAIAELEQMDRGRFAGPVGWMDSAGDGEWGIALRCAAVDGARVRLLAGCGIVADSDPAAELAESDAKLGTVRDALAGR